MCGKDADTRSVGVESVLFRRYYYGKVRHLPVKWSEGEAFYHDERILEGSLQLSQL